MRMSTLAVAVSAVAVLGWSGVGLASAAPPKCADLNGVVDANQICQIQATDPGYSLNISYPVDYPDAQPVFDYVKQTRDGFLNVAKIARLPRPCPTSWTPRRPNSVGRPAPRHPERGVQDLPGRRRRPSDDLLQVLQLGSQALASRSRSTTCSGQGTAPFPVILPLVQAEVDKQLGQPVTISPEDGLDPTKYQNFAVTNDSLIFFFSQGDVLPEAAGALQVAIPRGPVDAMIA